MKPPTDLVAAATLAGILIWQGPLLTRAGKRSGVAEVLGVIIYAVGWALLGVTLFRLVVTT